MAVSLSHTLLPFKNLHHNTLSYRFASSLSKFCVPITTTTTWTICKVVSKPNESLTSIITELEKERAAEDEEYLDDETTINVKPINHHNTEHRLSDVWREVHDEDEWVGLLDHMDPLLRSKLIRYSEMAQACYNAFDFDPFSKYCGTCRFTHGKFFEYLGMTHHGYQVSHYLFATSNINLPNFFKKSRWPKVWSKNPNWIVYVTVSDDETTARLGRRDINIAWRGTITWIEWIVDLIDFLKPLSATKIPYPRPDHV